MRKRKHSQGPLGCHKKQIIYYFACIIFAIIPTLAIVLNGADCLTSIQSNSSTDRLKLASDFAGSYKKNSETFRENTEKLTFYVKENTPIGSKLADIQLVEKDLTNMMCDIVGGADREHFTLRKDYNNKLELINEVNLDYESPKKTYNIVVRVTTLYFRYDADVDILVTDENDNKPQLEDFALVFNNYKNNFPSTPVGRVPASDADINDQLTYRVLAGNNAQVIIVNETTGDIQLSPWLNSNVPMKAVIEVAVSDGFNEAVAQLVLTVNLVTEPMLQNSVVLRLDGIGREEFLTRKYELFIKHIARILQADSMYSSNNIVIFNVEETLVENLPDTSDVGFQASRELGNSTLSINVSFSARAKDGNDVENYLSSQYIEERIYLNRVQLMNALEAYVAPFQDNLCVQEPCQNYQECHASYKFDKAKPFVTTRNMIFRPIRAIQSFSCTCPPTFTGMKHKSECDIQINQCFSNPCLNGGICHRHESGYSCQCPSEYVGHNCEFSFTNSTCQAIVPSDAQNSKAAALCGAKSKCVNKSHFLAGRPGQQLTSIIGGFSCQGCPYPQWSTELCQLKARSFAKSSYITLPSLKRRHKFHIMLQFATTQNEALIFYNGRFNDKHDFIALEIVDSYLKFSYSLGSTVTNVTLSSIPVSDGNWHKVAVDYNNRNVTLILDDCDPVLDEALSRIQSPVGRRCSNTSYEEESSKLEYRMLDLTSPMQLGALPSLPTTFQISTLKSFVGCMSDIYIDHQLVDLYSPIQDVGTQPGCQEKRNTCRQRYCNGHICMESWGSACNESDCNPDFAGEDRCIPICDLNPCQGENSKCYPITSNSEKILPDQTANSGYRCECEAHRSGKNCEHQLSPRCPSNWWGRPLPGGNSSICGPCNCDESKGFDGDCDKTTGQCICKSNHYQPLGSDYCLACDCYLPGSLSASCNQTSGQCKCRPGVVGRRCDTCSSPYAEVTLRGCEVIYDACPKTFVDGIWWDRTPLDKLATQQCPSSTSTGTARRYCTDSWQKPDMFDCISSTFAELLEKFRFFEENKFPLTSSLAMKVASDLRIALNETITNPSNQLYGSDMYISFRLIHHLIQYESKQTGLNLTHRQDRLYIRNLVESINYILDPAYAESWSEISARSPDGGAEHLLKLIDSYGRVLIENQLDTFTQPFEVSTKYFTFGMDIVSTDQLWDANKTPAFGVAASSPPYATDPFGPTLHDPLGAIANQEHSPHFNQDGPATYLDYSLGKDSSPAIILPKLDTTLNGQEDNTRVLIPLKTLKVKTMHELVSSPYYQAKSRAKREDLVLPVFKFIRQQPAIIVYSVFRSLGPLLPVYSDNSVQNRLGKTAESNSPVVWLTVRSANSSELVTKNIQPKINYILKVSEPSGRIRPQCAVWEFMPNSLANNKNHSSHRNRQTGKFTTKGCEIRGIHPNHRNRYKYDYVNCSCDHLGAVTVLMDSTEYDYITSETSSREMTVITGIGISISILITTLFVLSCIRGHSIKSNSNSINKNLILIMILIESLILYTVLARNSMDIKEYQCRLVAIFLHYFSISLFFWLLVNAIHFYRMLTELRDINHGPMKFYYVIGYAAPAFFVSIAVGLRVEHFGNYLFCWLSIREPIIWSMFGPISFASCLIIMLYLLAFCKTSPIKEDPGGTELLKNHMLINIVKTPLISAHWFLTVYVVNEVLMDHVYLYPILTVLKSIGLFVILCLIDRHIRYNIYVSYLHFKGEKVPFVEDANTQWMPSMAGEPGVFNKHYSYPGYGGQLTTPGFQSSCTDIFQPDLLALSAASTTSRSSATETSSSVYQYQYRAKDSARDGAYEKTHKRHRRRHKKSHHKHHHHKHHHHHHHHRSHRHHASEEYDYDLRKRYGQVESSVKETDSHNNLASSHSSDADDVSTLPKRNTSSRKSDMETSMNDTEPQRDTEKTSNVAQVQDESCISHAGRQTVPMEISVPSTSGQPSTIGTITEEPTPAGQEEALKDNLS